MKEKATLDQILEDLQERLELSEIAEKHGYSSNRSITERLKNHGYVLRSKMTKNEASYTGDRFGGLVSIPWSDLDELGLTSDDPIYHDIEPFQEDGEKGVKITFKDQRVKQVEEGEESE